MHSYDEDLKKKKDFEILGGGGETKNRHSELGLIKHMHALACTKRGCGELWRQVLEQHRGSCPPHPRGPGGGTNKQGQTRYGAARREAQSQLLTLQSLQARLAHHLPAAAAQGEPGDVAPVCSAQHPTAAPHTEMRCSTPDTIQAWRCSHISRLQHITHGGNPRRGLDQAGEMKFEFT